MTFDLLLVKHEDDSLFLVNQSKENFPLGQLRLGDDSKGGITGTEWGVEMLNSDKCVTAWRNTSIPRPLFATPKERSGGNYLGLIAPQIIAVAWLLFSASWRVAHGAEGSDAIVIGFALFNVLMHGGVFYVD